MRGADSGLPLAWSMEAVRRSSEKKGAAPSFAIGGHLKVLPRDNPPTLEPAPLIIVGSW